MVFQAGKNAGVWVNEFDFTSALTQYNWSRSRQIINVTTFGNDNKVFLPGVGEGSLSVQGVWDGAEDQPDEEFVALDGSQVLISASPTAAAAIGDRVHMLSGRLENYQPRAPQNDAVRFSASYVGDDSSFPGVVLHEYAAETTEGDHASVDGGAQSLNGATAFLHIVSFTGTNATVTIQDSADDDTFGSLVAFSQATGVGSQKVTATGTVERYVRVNLAGTFTSITFVVSFYRRP